MGDITQVKVIADELKSANVLVIGNCNLGLVFWDFTNLGD